MRSRGFLPLSIGLFALVAACAPASEPPPGPTALPPAESVPAPRPAVSIDRVGGAWVRCLGAFRPTTDVDADLARLTQLCGVEVGLEPVGEPLSGQLSEGETARFPLALDEGACGRVFAVGESTFVDLELAVEDLSGKELIADGAEDRWPILLPERPFCALHPGPSTLVVRARRGQGRFAWRLARVPAHGP